MSPVETAAELSLPAAVPADAVTALDVPSEGFDSIRDALNALAAGEFVVVLDDADRENEGDLIIAADRVTPEKVAFMVEHTSGTPATLPSASRPALA